MSLLDRQGNDYIVRHQWGKTGPDKLAFVDSYGSLITSYTIALETHFCSSFFSDVATIFATYGQFMRALELGVFFDGASQLTRVAGMVNNATNLESLKIITISWGLTLFFTALSAMPSVKVIFYVA